MVSWGTGIMDDGGGRWLTYTEAGGELGIKPEAVRSLARRRRWPRQSPNEIGGYARVLVPGRELIGASTRRSRPDGATGSTTPHTCGRGHGGGGYAIVNRNRLEACSALKGGGSLSGGRYQQFNCRVFRQSLEGERLETADPSRKEGVGGPRMAGVTGRASSTAASCRSPTC